MADPFTAIGGLAAVFQLSGTAMRFSRGLYRFARGVKSVTDEVDRFANQVQSFSNIIDLAQITLTRYCSEYPQSRVVAYLSTHRVLSNINSDAEYTLKHIRDVRERLKKAPAQFVLVTAIVWWLYKPSVMELYPEMESIKTNLSLLMTTTQLEASWQRASTLEQGNTRLQKEMNLLKRMLRSQMKAMDSLRRQLNRNRRVNGIQQTDGSFSPAHQNILLNLGWSMYEDDVVPDPLPISPSVSQQSLGSDTSASSSASAPSDGSNQNQAWDSESISTTSTPSTQSSRHPSIPSSPLTAVEPCSTQPDPLPEAAQHAAQSQPPGPMITNSVPPPSSLRVDTSSCSAVGGFIIPIGPLHINTNPRYASAFLVPDLPINIISVHSAGYYNVDIEWFEDNNVTRPSASAPDGAGGESGDGGGDGVLLDFGNGRRPERSVGRAAVHWSRESQRHNAYYMDYQQPPPLVVECEVCWNSDAGLIFGQPFMDERARRWRSED